MPRCRILLDVPRGGAWNMALDEVLLDRAADDDRPQLRIYSWSEPTVSLGYFQCHRERDSHQPSRHCHFVRRASGGGAIVHDHELTYALCLPGPWRATHQRDLHRRVHFALKSMLTRLGAAANLCPPTTVKSAAAEPFLCFQRQLEDDVILKGCKVVGSAQRRVSGAVLQHGSILVKRSPAAPELPGIEELSTIHLATDEWTWSVLDCLLGALGFEPIHVALSDAELATATALVGQKYGSPTWNLRR
jgi:lipoate-protein ligase A